MMRSCARRRSLNLALLFVEPDFETKENWQKNWQQDWPEGQTRCVQVSGLTSQNVTIFYHFSCYTAFSEHRLYAMRGISKQLADFIGGPNMDLDKSKIVTQDETGERAPIDQVEERVEAEMKRLKGEARKLVADGLQDEELARQGEQLQEEGERELREASEAE